MKIRNALRYLPHVVAAYGLSVFTLSRTGVSPARIALVLVVLTVVVAPLTLGVFFASRGREGGIVWRWIGAHPTPGALLVSGPFIVVVFFVSLLYESLNLDIVLSILFWIFLFAYFRTRWKSIVAQMVEASRQRQP